MVEPLGILSFEWIEGWLAIDLFIQRQGELDLAARGILDLSSPDRQP